MKHIFIDLEFCSCFRRSSPLACETIQVGAVMLDDKLRFVGEYGRLVGPDFATSIPSKERELTGITWEMVKDEAGFYDVMDDFLAWAGIKNEEFTFYSWSDNDPLQLMKESRVKGYPLKEMGVFDHWVDFQKCFMNALNLRSQISLEHAMELVQFEFAGDAHQADVDAYNTARLFKIMLRIENVTTKIELLSETRKNFAKAGEVNPKSGNPRYKAQNERFRNERRRNEKQKNNNLRGDKNRDDKAKQKRPDRRRNLRRKRKGAPKS